MSTTTTTTSTLFLHQRCELQVLYLSLSHSVYILSFQIQMQTKLAFPLFQCSCVSCGYELNLSSSNRNTNVIDSNYGKSMKRGVISFFSVDESRFTQTQQQLLPPWSWSWIPFLNSKGLSLFQRRRTKLLCRRCGNHLGYAHTLPSRSWDGISDSRIFHIKLTTLQPSFYDEQCPRNVVVGKYDNASSSSSLVF